MTPRQIRKLTEGLSVVIAGPAWADIGKLESHVFEAVRDRLLTLAARARTDARNAAENDEVQQVLTARVEGLDVRFQVDFERDQVVLLAVREP